MRDIKFRAWDTAKGKWIQDEKDIWLCVDDGRVCTLENTGGYEATDYLKGASVILTQFTGLLDKNGKEIYEGDIVQMDDCELLFTVGYAGGSFVISHVTSDAAIEHLLDKYSNYLVLIGNIYESPELLK